ncbi:MAG: hypothetical protein ACK5XN_38900 [Bacteroidota bacterium]
MQSSFNGAGQTSFSEQSGSFAGVRVTINNSSALTIAQLESANIQVNLQRQGKTTPVVSGPLYAAALALDPTQLEATSLQFGDTWSAGLYVDFGGVVNLKGNDQLQVTVNGAGLPATSNTVVSTEYGVGVEEFTPSIVIYPVDKTRSNFTLPAFDNVSAVTFIQTAAPAQTTTQLFTGINIQSDKWQASYNQSDNIALLAQQWDTTPTRTAFFAYVGEALDRCNIQFNINASGTGNGYVCVINGQCDPVQMERARALAERIVSKKIAKYNKKY